LCSPNGMVPYVGSLVVVDRSFNQTNNVPN
jgi:hypothetical protein